jgi:hypothetical protein
MLGMAKDLLIFSGFDNTPGLHYPVASDSG